VNSWFHYSSSLSKRRYCRIFKHDMIRIGGFTCQSLDRIAGFSRFT
jgi:hypothetical protein